MQRNVLLLFLLLALSFQAMEKHSPITPPNDTTKTQSEDEIKRRFILRQEMFEAVKKNDSEKLKKLIEKNKIDVNAMRDQQTQNYLLHTTVHNNQTKMVALLLHHGADPNLTNRGGYTALHMAISHANEQETHIINLLLRYGACVKRKAKALTQRKKKSNRVINGCNALTLAAINNKPVACETIVKFVLKPSKYQIKRTIHFYLCLVQLNRLNQGRLNIFIQQFKELFLSHINNIFRKENFPRLLALLQEETDYKQKPFTINPEIKILDPALYKSNEDEHINQDQTST